LATHLLSKLLVVLMLTAIAGAARASAEPPGDTSWARVTEDDRRIKIETDKLEAVIPKKEPKHWMTGIEKGSFLDKATGFREVGDGLMVVDWLMEAGSDEAYADQVYAPDGHGVGRYLWHTNETDPARKAYAVIAHGTSHRKRVVEGPQLCHRMKPVQPEVIRGEEFVAVKTTYNYEYAAPGRKPGSRWTQLVVFPKGERFFLLMDRIDSVNDSDEMFLRGDVPGCVRHQEGDTFSEIYLSYLKNLKKRTGPICRDGPKAGTDAQRWSSHKLGVSGFSGDGLRIPASEFFTPFPPDEKFNYRRDTHEMPEDFIRAYHLRGKETGKDGPWLAGMTLEPSIVYEAWCSQRSGGIIVMIEEIYGRPIKSGESFSAAHVVGYFDTISQMHALYNRYKGHTALTVDQSGWRLVE